MVEMGAARSLGADHAVNVVVMACRNKGLYFAAIHRAVFQIKPNAVVVVVRCVSNIERQ